MEDPFSDIAEYVEGIAAGGQGRIDEYELTGQPRLQPSASNIVAVKTFFPDMSNNLASDALNELHALRVFIGCPNIVQLLDVDIRIIDNEDEHEYQGVHASLMIPYYTSDLDVFIKTISFIERLKYSNDIINQLLTALAQLYHRGIIHRDIKPSNILMNYQYDKETKQLLSIPELYLADFGLSTQLSCNKAYRNLSTQSEAYTRAYRPPELFIDKPKYSEKADIWAAGITLAEFFMGSDLISPDSIYDSYVIQQILSKLQHPLPGDALNLQALQNLDIHDSIDVRKIFEENMSAFHFSAIPPETITLLTSMLAVNPDDRISITELIPNATLCKFIDMQLSRGESISLVKTSYYETVSELIRMSRTFKLMPRTCIAAIDLLDRYLHNYELQDDLLLVWSALLHLAANFIEIYAPELGDFMWFLKNKFTLNELRETEVSMLKDMDYIIISCEIDDYVHEVQNIPDVYLILDATYKLIDRDNIYAGSLPYSEIIQYFEIANKNFK